MKENWVVLLAAGLYVAFLSYVAGAMSVVGVNEDMPFGIFEFWLSRYQGYAAAGVALAAVIAAFAQIKEQRRHERKALAVRFAPELQSTQYAHDFAYDIERELDTSKKSEWKTNLSVISDEAIVIVNDHANAYIRGAFRLLATATSNYNSTSVSNRSTCEADVRRAAKLVLDLSTSTRDGIYLQINA